MNLYSGDLLLSLIYIMAPVQENAAVNLFSDVVLLVTLEYQFKIEWKLSRNGPVLLSFHWILNAEEDPTFTVSWKSSV